MFSIGGVPKENISIFLFIILFYFIFYDEESLPSFRLLRLSVQNNILKETPSERHSNSQSVQTVTIN
jgi:hypothetical protein